MPLDQLLERNRAFVRGRAAEVLPPAQTIEIAVVACYDPRLDGLLLPALGLAPGGAFLLRTAGALVQPAGGVMRSLALGVFMFGVREVVVVGHSSCRMATFETSAFIESFRKRGLTREAFGAVDLREWACAIPDPKRGVEISIANIAGAPFLPRDVTVSGLVLNDTTGELTVVPAGREQAVRTTSEPTRPTHQHGDHEAHDESPAAPEAPSGAAASAVSAERPAPLPGPLGTFVTTLDSLGHWPADVQRLRQELAGLKNPLTQLQVLKAFAQKASQESGEAARAWETLKRALRETGRGGRG